MTDKTSPPIWAIGDVQGCSDALRRLLSHTEIRKDRDARFWFAGDIINRGPDSLGALRQVMSLGDRAVTILGNHDLHLLGVSTGVRKKSKSDTLDDILDAPDAAELLDWLRRQPMAHLEHGHLLVHAGLAPQWDVPLAMAQARELESMLRAPDWRESLSRLFGNEPARWSPDLKGDDRRRFSINAMTRMRMCHPDGTLNFSHKGSPTDDPGELVPWFEVPGRKATGVTIVFGHWSTLGLMLRPNLIALDTGCVWGRKLTAVRLHDRAVVQVDA